MNFLFEAVATLARALREPAETLFDPSRRVFVPFLLCSATIALATLLARGAGLRRSARALFARRLWLHRSALADYKLMALKALLRAALFGSYTVSTIVIGAITAGWLRRHFGAPGLHASPLLVGLAYTLGAFLVDDYTRFVVHRAMHRVPLLWEFHKVHHSAEVLTPFSLYRTHPVESAINNARGVLAVGAFTGLAIWTFGPRLYAWQVLGVDALGFAWTLLGANLRHSHVWLSYGPRLERLVVSPAQHQVHHSRDPRHFDRNFGEALAVWDWLHGSLYTTTPRREALAFGLPAGDPHPGHGALALLLAPFVAIARRAAAAAARLAAPAGAPARRRAASTAMAAAALIIAGCTPGNMMMPTPMRLDRGELLRSFGRCAIGTYTEFRAAADGLAMATAALAAAPTDDARAAARRAWEGAVDVWQRAELLRFGPTAGLDALGGRGLREQVYAWPDVNRCLIEQQLVSRGYEGAAFADLPTSVRGLATIEYLLFYAGSDNACDAADPINQMGTWAQIPADELQRRKAAYAHAAAADVAARAQEILAAWEGPTGFAQQLASAGHGSTLFATQQVAFGAVAEAAFYLDTDVKDLRLGRPLGLVDCTTGACPEALESRYADRGKQHLRNNLAGVRLLLEGCAAGGDLGFDDLLVAAGAEALATQMRADLAAADAAVAAIPGESLAQALASDRASVERAHAAIREVTSFLKMEFTATLQITSQRVEGDQD